MGFIPTRRLKIETASVYIQALPLCLSLRTHIKQIHGCSIKLLMPQRSARFGTDIMVDDRFHNSARKGSVRQAHGFGSGVCGSFGSTTGRDGADGARASGSAPNDLLSVRKGRLIAKAKWSLCLVSSEQTRITSLNTGRHSRRGRNRHRAVYKSDPRTSTIPTHMTGAHSL